MSKHGYPEKQWQSGKEEMIRILREYASRERTIPYSELSSLVKSIWLDPRSDAMAQMLGEISTQENADGNGMLSVIVVHKTGDMKPGKGFYDCATTLGKDTSDHDALWIRETKAVFSAWAKPN